MTYYLVLACFFIAVISCGGNKKEYSKEITERAEAKVDSIMKSARAGVKDPNKSEYGVWELNHYIDEFGDKTDQAYLEAVAEGEFSNSATSNSYLVANILVNDSNDIRIMLHEYGRSRVKSSSIDNYEVKIKDNDGEVYSFGAYNPGDRLSLFEKKDNLKFNELLKKEVSLSFAIAELGSYSSATYRFKIHPKGYKKALKLLE